MHRTTLALSLAVLAAAPSTALAGADYRASVRGTLESTGTVTDTGCYPAGADAAETRTGEASVVARFRTTRPALVHVQRLHGSFPGVGLAHDDEPIRAKATVTRRSTLEDAVTPLGCSGYEPPEIDCGKRSFSFGIGIGTHGRGVSPDFSKTAYRLPEPEGVCPTTEGMAGFPSIIGGSGTAEVGGARLLHGRKLVLKGGRSGAKRIKRHGVSGGGSFKLRYTVTLTRVR